MRVFVMRVILFSTSLVVWGFLLAHNCLVQVLIEVSSTFFFCSLSSFGIRLLKNNLMVLLAFFSTKWKGIMALGEDILLASRFRT